MSGTVHPINATAARDARAAVIARFRLATEITKSEATAKIYGDAAQWLDQWLTARRDPRGFEQLDYEDLDAFLHAYTKGRDGFKPHAAGSASVVYRALVQFYGWHAKRKGGEYDSPMRHVTPRRAGEIRYEGKVLTEEQVDAVIGTAASRRDFTSIRDLAIMQLFRLGLRRSEVLVSVDDLDLRGRHDSTITVHGKGDHVGERSRTVALGPATILALLDYLEARESHPLAHRPELFLGQRGPLAPKGVWKMIKRRGEAVGIDGLYPHMFRHTAAHRWQDAGASESEGMEHFGWRSRTMWDRYGRATRAERARNTSRRIRLDG